MPKNTELIGMINASLTTISTLDFYFPFIVFFYGLVINFVLEIPHLFNLAKAKMPSQYATFQKHRKIAIVSLYVGGIWSLQNLWLS
jgi:hypothetical protein